MIENDLESLFGEKLRSRVEYDLNYIADQQDVIDEDLIGISFRREFEKAKSIILGYIDSGDVSLAKSLFSMVQKKFSELETKVQELKQAHDSFQIALKFVRNA
jgi:hypothetical protein